MAYQPQGGLHFDELEQALNELGEEKEDVPSDDADSDEMSDYLYNEYKLSWLLLGCPGSISQDNKRVRSRAPARGAKPARNGAIDLKGIIRDFVRAQEFCCDHMQDKKGYNHVTKWGARINSTMSDQSTWDAQLTAESARERIVNWLKTPADEYMFYFGGHGGKGRLGFAKDSCLGYDELAWVINHAKFRNKKAPLVTIIIDSCHSGSIYDAFRPYQQSKYSERSENDQGVLFQVIFSSLPSQVSYDEAFSKWLFDENRVKLWTQYFVNGSWDKDDWVRTFEFRKGKQQSGCFDFRPKPPHCSE